LNLANKKIQIAGSADRSTPSDILDYLHSIVSLLSKKLVEEQATFVLSLGGEPRAGNAEDGPPIIFDWTVLNSVRAALGSKTVENIVTTVGTTKTHKQIPSECESLYRYFQDTSQLNMYFLEPGWHSGSARRRIQAQMSDVLVAISGGEGVEHLAREYAEKGKPVIPCDINVGSSSNDGSGGAARLFGLALTNPNAFFRVEAGKSGGALLDKTRTNEGKVKQELVVANLLDLLKALVPPKIFYVRLLNPDIPEYAATETYFREVVDVVSKDMGFEPLQMGVGPNEFAWMNEAIFESLHYSAIVLVDLTAVRPNCFMELGYALGNAQRVLITAQVGTKIPFDPSPIETCLWNPSLPVDDQRKQLKSHWTRNINMPGLVKRKSFQ
jgi:TIR- and PNP-associating SLOG family